MDLDKALARCKGCDYLHKATLNRGNVYYDCDSAGESIEFVEKCPEEE